MASLVVDTYCEIGGASRKDGGSQHRRDEQSFGQAKVRAHGSFLGVQDGHRIRATSQVTGASRFRGSRVSRARPLERCSGCGCI